MYIDISDSGFTITDRYNKHKRFIVRRYACGHYTVKQTIKGRPVNTRAVRMTEKQVYQLGV